EENERSRENLLFDDGTEVEIRGIRDYDELFAGLEILDPLDQSIHEERIPSTASMESLSEDELVYLTPSALKRRLEVYLHTSPDFVIEPAALNRQNLVEDGRGVGYSESTNRKAISFQEAIEVMQNQGFQFVRKNDGKIVCVFDATVPRDHNTNGRFLKIILRDPLLRARTPETILSNHVGLAGFVTVTEKTTHGIVLAVNDLAKIYNAPTGYETISSNSLPDNAEFPIMEDNREGAYSGLTQYIEFHFQYLKETDAQWKQFYQDITAPTGQKHSITREQKIRFYHLLENKGMIAKMAAEGYFPNEPVYYFGYENKRTDLTMDSMQKDGYLAGLNKIGIEKFACPGYLLDELLWHFKNPHYRYRASQTAKSKD
ncbi:MAG TPA: hypothetical protein VJB65_00635, partial [Patescibacteria group bacterium]|nr:hypothetical protein [Patescibacteria group bacterium]